MNTEQQPKPEEEDPYKVDPPPPRILKFKAFIFLFHVTLCIACVTWWAQEDWTPNWLGLFLNVLFAIYHGTAIYTRYRLVVKLERQVRHFEALKRIVKTPVMQYDKDTNTTIFNWLISLSPDDVDKLEKQRKQ